MKTHTIHTPSFRAAVQRESGSAVLAALGILAVTLIAVGSALYESSNRFRTSKHSARWSQAGQASEAGADITMMTAQKNSWVADGWSAAPGAPGTAPVIKIITLASADPTMGTVTAALSVDKVTMGSAAWLRIRSKGIANVSGGARAGIDARDIMLRKLSLKKDRSTGATVATPQATRTVEVLAEPASKSLFVRPLLMQQKFTMSGSASVDSFDSADPAKSTGGLYDAAKRQSNGEVAIIDTQGASNLGGKPVYGNLVYGTGAAPSGTGGVTGTITTPFTETIQPVTTPTWTTFNATPAVISTSMTLTGGSQASPALYKVSSLTVGGGKVLTMAPSAPGVESYIEVWVTGNFTTSGNGYILQKPNVHVTYHIKGDVTISGTSFNNQANLAANNIINVISVGASASQKVTVSGNGTFIGVINAPAAAFTASGSAEMSGAIIGKTMNISGNGSVHYDEALGRMGGASGSSYRFASWVEAVR